MTDKEDIRGLIKGHFSYLITDYDFVDDPNTDTADICSEVRFKKNDWKVSIATTAHSTKISIKLISPSDDFGFLSHYFKTIDKDYETKNRTKTLSDDIQVHSEFLRTHGQDILAADPKRLAEILGLTKSEQIKWVEPLLKRHSDK